MPNSMTLIFSAVAAVSAIVGNIAFFRMQAEIVRAGTYRRKRFLNILDVGEVFTKYQLRREMRMAPGWPVAAFVISTAGILAFAAYLVLVPRAF